VADLYRHFGIDRNSILRVIEAMAPGRPLRAVEASERCPHGSQGVSA
jgi:hypothetical protein